MFGLYSSLSFLGLSAIDPIGIGIIPVLLVQKKPYRRVAAFLGGSFMSLMAMGLLLAKGLGQIVLRFEHDHSWFVPVVETVAGFVLLAIAITVYVRLRAGKTSGETSKSTIRWLQLGNLQLFLFGGLLVVIQSIIDVVFVIAMIRIGQLRLSNLIIITSVATYAITALALQLVVVVAFRFAPHEQKAKMLERVRSSLVRYSSQAIVIISLILSVLLFTLALIK